MDLTRVRKDIANCNFPDWVNGKTWKVIPRGGLRPRMDSQENNANMQQRVSFPDRKSFILGIGTDPASIHGQKFKCAKVVNATTMKFTFKHSHNHNVMENITAFMP